MTSSIPPAWIEAALVEILTRGPGKGVRDHIEATIAAVLPLIVRDMMEPSETVLDARFETECEIERDSGHPMGGKTTHSLYHEEARAILRAMLRAWARERGVKLEGEGT